MTPEIHPSADLLSAFAEGMLTATERERILEHAAGCPRCRAILFTVQRATPAEEHAGEVRRMGWVPVAGIAAAMLLFSVSIYWYSLHPVAAPPAGLAEQRKPVLPAQTATEEKPNVAPAKPRKSPERLSPAETTVQPQKDVTTDPVEIAGALQPPPKMRMLQKRQSRGEEQSNAAKPQPAGAAYGAAAPLRPNAGRAFGTGHGGSIASMPRADASTAVFSANATVQDSVAAASLNSSQLEGGLAAPDGKRAKTQLDLPDRILRLTDDGLLQFTMDGGKHWRAVDAVWSGKALSLSLAQETQPSGRAWHFFHHHPRLPAVLLETDSSETWISTNGGKSWKPYQRPR